MAAAAAGDIREYRISNRYLGFALIAGISGALTWEREVWQNAVVCGRFYDPSDYSGDIGISHIPKGDDRSWGCKMAALFTAWLGVRDGLKALTIGFMLGAVLALLKMLRQGSMVKRFLYLSAYIRHSFQSRMMEIYYDPQGTEERRSSRWEPAFLWEQPRQRYGRGCERGA